MIPRNFKHANLELKRPESMTDEECGPLQVFTDGKQTISCWKASLLERLKIFITGKVWCSVYMGRTQPPIWMGGNSPFIKRKV